MAWRGQRRAGEAWTQGEHGHRSPTRYSPSAPSHLAPAPLPHPAGAHGAAPGPRLLSGAVSVGGRAVGSWRGCGAACCIRLAPPCPSCSVAAADLIDAPRPCLCLAGGSTRRSRAARSGPTWWRSCRCANAAPCEGACAWSAHACFFACAGERVCAVQVGVHCLIGQADKAQAQPGTGCAPCPCLVKPPPHACCVFRNQPPLAACRSCAA